MTDQVDRARLPLALLGGATLALYFLYLPIPAKVEPDLALLGRTWAPAREAAALASSMLGGAQESAAGTVTLVTLLAGLYLLALGVARGPGSPGLRRLVAGFAALFAGVLLLQPSLLSSDAFTYLLDGRIQVLHGQNPYQVIRASMVADPALAIQPQRELLELPNPYGPVPVMLSALVVGLAGPGLAAELLAWKALALLCGGLSLLVLDRLAARHWPDQRLWTLVAVAWNPLVLLQVVGDAHNEFLVLLLVLLAVEQILRERPAWAGALLGLAVMTKAPSGVLAAAYGLFLLRRHPVALLRAVPAGAGVCLLLLLPYGAPTLRMFESMLRHSELYANSFFMVIGYAVGKALLATGVPAPTAGMLVHDLLRPALGLAVLAALAAASWTAPTPEALVRRSAAVWYGVYLLVTPYFWPWYVAVPLALLCLGPRAPLRASALCLSLTGLGILLPVAVGTLPMASKVARVAMLYAPALVLAVVGFLRPRAPSEG